MVARSRSTLTPKLCATMHRKYRVSITYAGRINLRGACFRTNLECVCMCVEIHTLTLECMIARLNLSVWNRLLVTFTNNNTLTCSHTEIRSTQFIKSGRHDRAPYTYLICYNNNDVGDQVNAVYTRARVRIYSKRIIVHTHARACASQYLRTRSATRRDLPTSQGYQSLCRK